MQASSDFQHLQPVGALLRQALKGSAAIEATSGECSEHGMFQTMTRRGLSPACPTCVASKAQQDLADYAKTTHRESLAALANLPARYRDATLRGYPLEHGQQTVVVKQLSAYLRARKANLAAGAGLIFVGPPGTGKTRLACAVANNFIHAGVSVRYTTMPDMIADIRSAYGAEGKSEAAQVERFVSGCEVLILDEVDVFKSDGQADMNLIFRVIDGRYLAGKTTIALTNQTVEGLDRCLGDRVASRLRDNSTVLVCDWPCYRKVLS